MVSASSHKLQAALSTIAQAMQHLERASALRAERETMLRAEFETTLSATHAEQDRLVRDNQRLSNELQQVQLDFLQLQEAAAATVARLDNSVEHIDRILEH